MQVKEFNSNSLIQDLPKENEAVAETPLELHHKQQRVLLWALTVFIAILIATNIYHWFKSKNAVANLDQTQTDLMVKEAELGSITHNIQEKEAYILELETSYSQQAASIEEMKETQAQIQSNLEENELAIKTYQEKIANFEQTMDIVRLAHQEELAGLQNQLRQLENEKQQEFMALSLLLQQTQEKNQQLETDLTTYSAQHNEIAETAKLTEQGYLLSYLEMVNAKNQELEVIANTPAVADAVTMRHEVVSLKERLAKEQSARAAQDALFSELSMSLKAQKEGLNSLESTREGLAAELVSTQKQYAELLENVSSATKKEEAAAATPVAAAETTNASAKKIHIVMRGDTLSSISQRYYGTSKRWNDIYQANKDVLPNRDQIKTGIALTIPE